MKSKEFELIGFSNSDLKGGGGGGGGGVVGGLGCAVVWFC